MKKLDKFFIATLVAMLASSAILLGAVHISEAKKSSQQDARALQREQIKLRQQEQQQQNLQTQAVQTPTATTQATTSGGVTNLADNSVTSPKIKNFEVKTEDIANGAVTKQKLAADAFPTSFKLVSERRVTEGSINMQSVGQVTVDCNADEVVTGGGFEFGISVGGLQTVKASQQNGNGWLVQVYNPDTAPVHANAYATCTHLEVVN